jgi:sugar/nucleoside kinase (ribokinase family)
MKEFDVLVAGEINPDLILSQPGLEPKFGQQEILVQSAELTIGSSSAIYACGASRLGLKVAFIGVIGDDMFGHYMLEAMHARGVNVSNVIVDPDQKTGLSVILNRRTDRAILTHLGTIDALRVEHIPNDLLMKTRHLHVASYFLQKSLQPGLRNLFRKASASGITTSLDANWDPEGNWAAVASILPEVSIFFPNEAEAMAITGTTGIETALKRIRQYTNLSAVKLGVNGAAVVDKNQVVQVPSLPGEVADTVGAGDSFDAGFTFGFLKGWSLEKSLKLAVACGSLSTRAHGGTDAQPTLEAALTALDLYV